MSDVQSIPSSSGTTHEAARRSSFLTGPLERVLRHITCGSISVVLPNGRCVTASAPLPGPHAKLVVRRWRALWRLATGGDLAFARAYIEADWSTPDLLAVLEFGARNADVLATTTSGTVATRLLHRLRHWANRNTRHGSRRNIAAHYDLGNDFYAPWLDRGMTYSSALFSDESQTLEQAQQAKLDRIITLLQLTGGERVLEIGCGWGSLAERLVPLCEVTGITLSAEQLAYAKQRLSRDDGTVSADLRLQDYRDVKGQFDRIVSIEMIEAVGEKYWPLYFARLNELLAPGGVAVLQAITIREDRFAAYRGQPDFIQRYIFPGGMLPTVESIRTQAARAGLALASYECFGPSYAQTLAIWRERFLDAWPEIQALGFDAPFKRAWEYYLCYCEAGFRTDALDVGIFLLLKG